MVFAGPSTCFLWTYVQDSPIQLTTFNATQQNYFKVSVGIEILLCQRLVK